MFVRKNRGFFFRMFSVVTVSLYLIGAYFWLRLRGQVRPECSLFKLFTGTFRHRYAGVLSDVHPENGHCFTAAVPEELMSDADGGSRLRVFEDGLPLQCPNADHQVIRKKGMGAFSHWGRFLYFSSSDNTDPRENGRRYSVREV